MNLVKTEFQNRLGQVRLETLLIQIVTFSKWYEEKIRRVSAVKPHNYSKSLPVLNGIMYIVGFNDEISLVGFNLSDLEDDDDDIFDGFEIFCNFLKST